MRIETVPLSSIKPNPTNPRTIKDDRFKRLVQSIKDFPEMREAREIVVNKDMVILGGNMRYRAMQEAKVKEAPVKIVDWSEEKQREFIIKDNIESGDWDYDTLANEWDKEELNKWGMGFDWLDGMPEELNPEYSQKLGEVIYEPKQTDHKIKDLYQPEHKFDEEIEAIENKELREMLQARAYNFYVFNYEKIADYYAYQATPQEQRIIEKLALVLLDKDKLIEYGFSKLIKDIDLNKKDYEDET